MSQLKLNIASTVFRQDRKEVLKLKLDALSSSFTYEFFDGKNKVPSPGYKDLVTTFKKIISDNLDADFVIILEDDIDPLQSFSKLQEFIKQAPEADILLGGLTVAHKVEPVIGNYAKVHIFRGTHCVIVFKSAYDFILKQSSSQFMSDILNKPDLRKYVIMPFIASQTNSVPNRVYGREESYPDMPAKVTEAQEKILTLPKIETNGTI